MIKASRDEIIKEKEVRRKQIKELEYHANNDLIHIGKISRGCRACFQRNGIDQFSVYTGVECNANCGYCYYDVKRNNNNYGTKQKISDNLANLYFQIMMSNGGLREISYNSLGETLMYPAVISEASKMIKRYQEDYNIKVYSHLYTNGILADNDMLDFLKDCEVTELRFHHSASNFSDKVLNNIKMAKEKGFVVTIEEPSLPENKDKIIEHLPIYNDIGINHLDLVECQVTPDNYDYLNKTYPNGKMYRDILWHLYDEGMVYDIIEEIIKNKYNFSIIDCNSRVEVCRKSEQINNNFNSNLDIENALTKDLNSKFEFDKIKI